MMRLRRMFSSLALAGVVLSSQLPAQAQDASELKKARAQFQQATELEQAGNWTAALQAFREVGQVRMTPQVRFHIAVCEENLGRLVAALGGYELALADADKVNPDFKGEVEENVTKLRARIPKLVIERGAGASAAAIELDGVAVGDSSVGVEVPLDPGPHAVTAKAPNRKPFETSVTLKEEETTRLEVKLEELPPELLRTGGGAAAPDKPPSKVVPLVIGGVGVVSLVGSGVLFGLRQKTLSELNDACGAEGKHCPLSMQSKYDDLKFYHYGSMVTLGVGVAAVGTAAALLVLQRKKEPAKDKDSVALQLVPSMPLSRQEPLGATVLGTF
ncbi:MAG TPA: PEGA domain-containing protein [Polyangiaceae bacterium]|nr:PEGA domain-containing protein [Polyangiaceae bacterium]